MILKERFYEIKKKDFMILMTKLNMKLALIIFIIIKS